MSEQDMQADELLGAFCDEAMDLLQDLPDKLSEFAQAPSGAGPINEVFRAVHKIKGNAGFFGLPTVKEFAHSLEDTFDEIRQDKVLLEDELSRYLVEGLDLLGEMIVQIQTGEMDVKFDDRHATLLERIQASADELRTEAAEADLLDKILQLADEIAAAGLPQCVDWSNRLRAMTSASSDAEGTPEEASTQADKEGLSVDSLAGHRFECAGTEITDRVKPLLALFLAVNKNTYEKEDGKAFLQDIDDLADWSEQHEQTDVASVLRAVRDDIGTIYNSPLEMDSLLLSIPWERLAPTLYDLRCVEPTGKAKKSDNGATSEEAGRKQNSLRWRNCQSKQHNG